MDCTIENFINTVNNNNYSIGNGDDNGNGYGHGYGYGYGNGNGYGDGNGNYGNGYGYGDGNGNYGNGNDDGNGYGNGDGNGYGYGNGYKIKQINDMPVVEIDDIPTVIKCIKGNIIKGYTFINFQLVPCYVIKQDGYFAHGKTVREATHALQNKILLNTPIEERIDAFLSEIKTDKEYRAKVFYDWHHRLTGSCEFGRNEFIERHNISLDEMMTVKRFIELTKNDYGGEIIKELEKKLNELTVTAPQDFKGDRNNDK